MPGKSILFIFLVDISFTAIYTVCIEFYYIIYITLYIKDFIIYYESSLWIKVTNSEPELIPVGINLLVNFFSG